MGGLIVTAKYMQRRKLQEWATAYTFLLPDVVGLFLFVFFRSFMRSMSAYIAGMPLRLAPLSVLATMLH